MRVKFLRVFGVALLYGLPHLFAPGCSSSKQQDEDIEASEQGDTGNQEANSQGEGEGDEEAEANVEGNGEEGAENTANEEVANGNAVAEEGEGNGGEEEALMDGEQTTNDLQDIIAGQNANQGTDTAAAGEEATPEATAEEVPVEDATAATVATETAPAEAAPAEVPQKTEETAAAPAPSKGAGKNLPEMGSKMPYIVRAGDTLGKIAQQIFGDQEKWKEIAELSSIKNPNHVRPGDVVYYQLSEKSMAFAGAYEGTPRMELKVNRGETLSTIAQRVYGSPMDWKAIWRQNADITNPDKLEVGQTLVYLAPASLSAALDYAKSIKVADLIKVNYDKMDPQSKTQTTNADASVEQVDGFQIAQGMFNVFANNFGVEG